MTPGPGFWESLLRPINSSTAVTPTIAVIKLVTPLSIVLSAFAAKPVNEYLFYLGASPVAVVLAHIIYFSGKHRELLSSEPHKEAMAELEGRFGSNDGTGPRDIKLARAAKLTGNPQMATDDEALHLLEGQQK